MNNQAKCQIIIEYTTNHTPDGEFHIIFDSDGIARASGFGNIQDLKERLPEELRSASLVSVDSHPYQKLVQAYYDGDKNALDAIPLDQTGSDFQKKVWQAISEVPYGKTISYKELAEKSGNPVAVRAVGAICGLNRLILLIPCHRILKSDGGIGNYLYGYEIKKSLLQHENAAI